MKRFPLLFKLLSTAINLLIPGAGLVILGHFRLALIIQAALFTAVFLLSWTRLILEPVGIQLFVSASILSYLLSMLLSFIVKLDNQYNLVHRLIFTGVFCTLTLSLLTTVFVAKQELLGIHVYFVPSASMEPTLKPGQFILLDTWAYHDNVPSLNDVVVFEHGIKKQHLVKRISLWPSAKLTKNSLLWYVTGDNRSSSQDSRYFGGVTAEQLIGEVKLVLVAFDKKKSLKIDILLTPVR
jgi:signal peptidase I